MKKVLFNVSILLAFGATSFAQSIGKTLPTEQAKMSKHLTNSGVSSNQIINSSRAEGDIIWSDDFSTPANWGFSNASQPPHGWSITTNLNAPPAATQTAPLRPVNFPTGSNGYAICDSDSAGDGSTTNATITWSGTPIDCSANPNVSLRFRAVTRNWSSQYFVRVSGDNGASWSEFPVLQNITTNMNTANSEEVTLNITSAAGSASEVLIGFRYQASWGWFWAVDDVELFETWNYDLVTNQTISSLGAAEFKYTIYPVGQVIAGLRMGFGADVRNNGAMAMLPALKATQGNWSATGSQVTINPNQIQDDSLAILAANGFPIPSTAGQYDITLDLTTEETIQNPAAVVKMMPFSVSPLVMAGDDFNGNVNTLSGGFFGWASATGDPGIGREFEINTNAAIGRISVGIANVTAANQGDYIDNELFVELWKVVDGEPVFVAITDAHVITASNFGNLVHCYFENPVQVAAGDILIAVASSSETALVPVAFSGLHLAGNTVGKAGSGFVTLASDGDYVEVPVVRLDFGDYTGIAENTIISEDVTVYPNPASDNITLSYSLTEQAEVNVVVRDLTGKVVLAMNQGLLGAGAYNLTIESASFAQGMYTVTLNANGATSTQKLIKK